MPFNMAWFRAQEEKKKAEELAKKLAENPNYKEATVKVASSSDDQGYYKFHRNTNYKENKHYFLSEECLVPHANSTDTQRLNMWANHINQFVHLKNPEYPRVFTNFENQVGEYSVAYKKAKENFEVLAKVVKNEYNHDLIVRYKSGLYDIIHFNHAKNITEDYGYRVNDCIPEVDVGDTVQKGNFIYKSDNYDDDGNFMIGCNLKAVYLAYKNLTYEDGVVISESAAKKLTSFKVEQTTFSINTNDILLNLYGDDEVYKSFPKVGDYIDSKILVASRRRDKKTALYELQSSRMKSVDSVNDEVIYTGGGTVVDIDIFSNKSLKDLRERKDVFNQEVLEVAENNMRYWKELAEELEKIVPCKVLSEKEFKDEKSEFGHVCKHPIERDKNPNKVTDELLYYWKLSHEYIDDRIQWRSDGKSFDNFKMKFTILKENPVTPGVKITGRYGNKGIISAIIPDSEMPKTLEGECADICLNPLGVINRLNPAQLQEQYINFMSDHVVKLMKATDDYSEKEEIFFSYLKAINKEQFDFYDIEFISMNRSQKYEFLDSVEENGIYIHQPPFFGNTSKEQFKKIFKEHPEWCTDYVFEGIENPMTMGDLYFIRLKHESSNKMSVRSGGNLNVKNLPAKSTLKKQKKILYSSTPIRLGEMEVNNLLISKRPDIIEKLLKSYSTNEDLREETIRQLLVPGRLPNGHLKNPLDMDLDLDLRNSKSVSREILEKYLNVLGYSLEDNIGGENGENSSL